MQFLRVPTVLRRWGGRSGGGNDGDDSDNGAVWSVFDSCQDLLPDMEGVNLWPDFDWDATTMQFASGWNQTGAWVDDLDWGGIEETLGGLAEDLHLLLDQALANYDTSFPDFDSFPVTCNPGGSGKEAGAAAIMRRRVWRWLRVGGHSGGGKEEKGVAAAMRRRTW